MQLFVARFSTGFVAFEPFVDVDARPLYNDQLAEAHCGGRGGSQRTQHLAQHRISLRTSARQRGIQQAGTEALRGVLHTLSHGDGEAPVELMNQSHAADA